MDPKLQPGIISRQIVKPSSSATHSAIHNLSFFDQLGPPFYFSILVFYKISADDDTDHQKYSSLLKLSLSTALSEFYPLAGRIKDHLSVECNDEGALFLEARMECSLSEFLKNADDEILELLFPDGLCNKYLIPAGPIVVVQVTYFTRGGLSIGLCLCHRILDMPSISLFINQWASIARKSYRRIVLDFSLGSSYPPLDHPFPKQSQFLPLEISSCALKRLVFDGSKIAKLKAMVADQVPNPTGVEVVTALLYKLASSAAAKASSNGSSKPSIMYHSMNLRPRVSPPVSGESVGNLVVVFLVPTEGDKEADLGQLVREFREAKTRFSDSIAKTSDADELCRLILESMTSVLKCCGDEHQQVYGFTSWCSFGIYEADFGWGKPWWATGIFWKLKNVISLMDTREGDGIEAHISLEKNELDLFVNYEELLSFCSINPSVLD